MFLIIIVIIVIIMIIIYSYFCEEEGLRGAGRGKREIGKGMSVCIYLQG